MAENSKKLLGDWAIEEQALKQKEAELTKQIELINAAIEEASSMNETVSSQISETQSTIITTSQEYQNKIANIDKAINVQRAT